MLAVSFQSAFNPLSIRFQSALFLIRFGKSALFLIRFGKSAFYNYNPLSTHAILRSTVAALRDNGVPLIKKEQNISPLNEFQSRRDGSLRVTNNVSQSVRRKYICPSSVGRS